MPETISVTMPHQVEYSTLLPLFIELIESQSGKELPLGELWLNDAQVLSTKLFHHLVSMNYLAKGTTIEAAEIENFSYIDHGSIKVIARASLETYLVFFYLFVGDDLELSKFRHNLWHLGGLSERQKYEMTIENGRAVLNLEKQAMRKLQVEIENSPFFDTYTDNQKRQLLKGAWRTGISWISLGISAGFDPRYFKNTYNYLCGYSHSSYASIMQVGQAQTLEDQRMLTHSILGIGLVIMGHFIFTYPTVFPDAASIVAQNPLVRRVAEQWRFGPSDTTVDFDA